MSDHHFWLSEAQLARLEPLLPNKPRGVPRVDDRRLISGIVHVIRGGLTWRDAPAACGPPKTLRNRFFRWSRIGVFDRIFAALPGESAATDAVVIDVEPVVRHRSENHWRGRLKARRAAASLLKKGFPAGKRSTGSISDQPAIPAASGEPGAA